MHAAGGSADEAATTLERYKQQAAERAAEFVGSGMVVGLGTGTTAIYATRRIGQLLREGALHNLVGVATSRVMAREAQRLGIPLLPEDADAEIDLTIDGADEVSPELHLIKGAGGALLREKIVAQSTAREIIVIDSSKLSSRLGTTRRVPVEVVPFGWHRQVRYLRDLGGSPTLRTNADGSPFTTDQGNYIVDSAFGPIENPAELAARLRARAGIVEHGIFIGLASEVIVAGPDGIEHRSAAPRNPS